MPQNELAVPLSPRFADALRLCYEKHRTQPRKVTQIPYVSHPLAVASIVLENGGTEDEAIAGLLHDVPEDCGGLAALEDIRARFGDAVADIVAGCSDTFESPKPDWGPRKQRYLEHLKQASPSVCLVAAADKLHNARAILGDYQTVREELWERFSAGGPEGVLWYYQSCAGALNGRVPPRLGDELSTTVRRICAMAAGNPTE